MLMRSLEAHGLPEVLLEAWEHTYGPELLPIQERAVTADVLGGPDLAERLPTATARRRKGGGGKADANAVPVAQATSPVHPAGNPTNGLECATNDAAHRNTGPRAASASDRSDAGEASVGDPPLLIPDARRPDQALLRDQPVPLRPAEFRLLRVLAEQPGKCVAYDDIYRKMWGGEHFVEPAQIYSHRSRLGQKLLGALPARAEPLIRTLPTHGLMLDLGPEQVSLR